jgi:hypothetical protein
MNVISLICYCCPGFKICDIKSPVSKATFYQCEIEKVKNIGIERFMHHYNAIFEMLCGFGARKSTREMLLIDILTVVSILSAEMESLKEKVDKCLN